MIKDATTEQSTQSATPSHPDRHERIITALLTLPLAWGATAIAALLFALLALPLSFIATRDPYVSLFAPIAGIAGAVGIWQGVMISSVLWLPLTWLYPVRWRERVAHWLWSGLVAAMAFAWAPFVFDLMPLLRTHVADNFPTFLPAIAGAGGVLADSLLVPHTGALPLSAGTPAIRRLVVYTAALAIWTEGALLLLQSAGVLSPR